MPSAALVMPAPQESSLVSVKSGTLLLTALGAVTVARRGGRRSSFFGMKSKRARHGVPRLRRRCCRARAILRGMPARSRGGAAARGRRTRRTRQRAEEAEQRQQREQADQQRQDALRQEEDERLRQLDEQRRPEDEERRREEDARHEEAEARRQSRGAAAPGVRDVSDEGDSEFDPYLGLGLPPDATADQVRAAYEEARQKYDPDLVEHLGFDVKEHFAERFKTVERAYRMITGAPGISGNR